MSRAWDEGVEREIASTRIFTVTATTCALPAHPGSAIEAVRLRCPDWVNVVALTPDRQVVLVEQYRHGTRETTLEIPGGMVDLGETPEEACARELLEETGFAGQPVRILGTTRPNPAFQMNRLTTGLVLEAREVGPAKGDGHEDITVRLVPESELPRLVRDGAIDHALVLAAFHLFALKGDGRDPNRP
jgi:8-oxo-dGTP pyrophosphatase MutT (NUDIX family)